MSLGCCWIAHQSWSWIIDSHMIQPTKVQYRYTQSPCGVIVAQRKMLSTPRHVLVKAKSDKSSVIQTIPAETTRPSTSYMTVKSTPVLPWLLVAGSFVALWAWWNKNRAGGQGDVIEKPTRLGSIDASPSGRMLDTILDQQGQDGREYKMALSRTRQAVAIHRAIGFLNTKNTARAMVELRRALHENSVCRAPLVNAQHDTQQLQELYRLHLENSSVPPDFGILLQLRTLLDLDFDLAEKIEREVMEQGSAYNI